MVVVGCRLVSMALTASRHGIQFEPPFEIGGELDVVVVDEHAGRSPARRSFPLVYERFKNRDRSYGFGLKGTVPKSRL